MFTRPQPPVPDPLAGISIASPVRPSGRRLLRLFKRGVALGLLALGGGVFLQNAGHVTSDNAVVTAHLTPLRAPIEGVVQTRAGAVGVPVAAGALLAEIVNPLADDRPVTDLGLTVKRLTASMDALRIQRQGLQAILADLNDRVARHRDAKRQQLAFEAARAERDRAAKAGTLQQLIRDMNRKVALTGTVSIADIEQATTAVRVAADQLAAFEQQAAEAAAVEQAAGQGVLVEANSGNDVAYSEQRADEVRVRLVELDRTIAMTEAELTEATGRLHSEQDIYARHRAARLTIPSAGMIWRLGAGPGERVTPGDILAQTVDCGAAYLVANVPQDRVADIDLTAPATFQLAGERQDRSGSISAILGAQAVAGDTASAVTPASGTRPVASVIIALPASPNERSDCLVGRTAKVQLQATRTGWLAALRRWLPL